MLALTVRRRTSIMKKFTLVILCGFIVAMVSGCGTTRLQKMQMKAMKIRDNGGLAEAAMGSSAKQSLSYEKAKLRARTGVAELMETRIQSLKKDFQEEVGEAESSEYNELFSIATKNLVNTKLSGSAVKEIDYEKTDGGWEAYVIVVLDPSIMADYFKQAGNDYTRFRASQAFKDLDSEIEKYEEWQLRDKAIMMGGSGEKEKK
jgi:hypothetical protein